MKLEMSEIRDALSLEALSMVEKCVNELKSEDRPFYIVVCAKADNNNPGHINATIQHYFERPPAMLGLLVWYVDQTKGIVDFIPELSFPPDVPIDPTLLSDDPKDCSARVAESGEKMKVLLS